MLPLLTMLLRCRRGQRSSRGPVRLEVLKLTAATTYHFPGTFTVDLAIASAMAERSAGPYHIDVGADQNMLPGSSHSCLGFSPRTEARATCGLLEDISTRLHDMFAKKE